MPTLKFLICTGIYPPEIGGPATVMAELVSDLRKAGHEARVLTYGDRDVEEKDVRWISRKRLLPFRYLVFASAVRQSLTPDTIICCVDVYSTGIPVRLALTGKKNRLLIRLGGEWCWEDAVTKGRFYGTLRQFWSRSSLTLRDRLMRWNYRWMLNRAERIYLTSDFLKEIVEKIVPRAGERMEVVMNVPATPDLAIPRSISPMDRGDAPHAPLRLLYVGRFAPVKNVPFLARVLKRLHEQGVAIECAFAGSGPDEAEVKKILEGVPGMVFFGKVVPSGLRKLYSEADLLVLPSLSDICPNAVLEALAAGLPCVITSEHGLGALGGVFEVDPQSERDWIEAVRALTDVRRYQELQKRARFQQENRRFSLADRMVADIAGPLT